MNEGDDVKIEIIRLLPFSTLYQSMSEARGGLISGVAAQVLGSVHA